MTADEARILQEVERILQETRLLEDTRPLLVAVSGGPDSLALLHLLHTLSGRHPLSLHVAHLNHGQRGEAAEEDAAYVREVAGRLLEVTAEVARGEGLAERGYRVAINTGPESGSEVLHLHLHVLGGKQMRAMG